MEQKISKTDELHLTRAIEKAAALAAVNDSHDRNSLLADQLKQEKVDKRFAKTATAAFNKRMTVLILQKTADEHKGDSYDLASPDTVYELMGGAPEQDKKASVQSDFFIEFRPAMQKVATAVAEHQKKPYEATVRLDTYMEHLEGVIDKQAAEFSELNGVYESLDSKIADETADVVSELRKLGSASFELTTLGKLYGAELSDIIGAYMDCGTMEKSAAVVKPEGGIYDKVAHLIEDTRSLKNIRDYICSYKEGLSEFLKTATVMADVVDWARYHGADMTKIAADDWSEETQIRLQNAVKNRARGAAVGSLLTNALGTSIATANEGVNLAKDTLHTLHNDLSSGFGNAFKLYNASRDPDLSANKVLDSEFITNDRYRDRLMAWSDMTADPMFSMYPANQVFSATQKALNSNLSLERPDNREYLRSTVGQLLAQNNRFSSADLAALAQTLKGLSSAQQAGGVSAGQAAKEDSKVERKQPVELSAVFQPVVSSSSTDITDVMSRAVDNAEDRRNKLRDQVFDYKLRGIEAEGKRNSAVREMALRTIQAEHPNQRVIVDATGRPVLEDDSGARTAVPEAALNKALIEANRTQQAFGTAGLDVMREELDNRSTRSDTERGIALKILQMDNPDQRIAIDNGRIVRLDSNGMPTPVADADASRALEEARSMRMQFGSAAAALADENLKGTREHNDSARDKTRATNELAMQAMLNANKGVSATRDSNGDFAITKADGTTTAVTANDFQRYVQPAERAVELLGVDGARRMGNEVERLSDRYERQTDRAESKQRQHKEDTRRDTINRMEDALRPRRQAAEDTRNALNSLMGEAAISYANNNNISNPKQPRVIGNTEPGGNRAITLVLGDNAKANAKPNARITISEQDMLARVNANRQAQGEPPLTQNSAEWNYAWDHITGRGSSDKGNK